MALDLFEQHLGWQQRINREVAAASRFYKLHDHLAGSHYYSWNKRPKRVVKDIRPKSKCVEETPPKQSMGRVNVYAEVRGKYARPPPIDKLHRKHCSVVVKPSTAGSLRSMYSHRRSVCSDEIVEEAKPKRSLAFEETKKVKKLDLLKEKVEEVQEEEKVEEEEANVEEEENAEEIYWLF